MIGPKRRCGRLCVNHIDAKSIDVAGGDGPNRHGVVLALVGAVTIDAVVPM